GGTSGTTPLAIALTGQVTPAAVQALVRNVTYQNVSQNPSTSPRTVRFVLGDGDGGTSSPATKDVAVTAVNDPPLVATTAGAAAYTEGAPGTVIDPGVTVTDPDSPNFAGGTLTVSLSANGTAD